MKKTVILFISLFLLLFLFSCDKATETDSELPTVVIISPADSAAFAEGTLITITANATDNRGIKEVRFYIDETFKFIDQDEPYEYKWNTSTAANTSHTIYTKAYDTSDNTSLSTLITITLFDVNLPPNIPSDPHPANSSTSVSIYTSLSWECSDPDGDLLTYDVYLGTTTNPPLVSCGQSNTTYEPETLSYETTYYWKIKAQDDSANSTTSDIWELTTVNDDFEWRLIPAGDYTYGYAPSILNIPYDYQIMKYEVTNQQYVDYLEEALANGDITVSTVTVKGYFPGNNYYGAGIYEFLDLFDSDCRIDWNGNSFSIISGYEEHPVVEVTWFGAWAFAEHYGFSLPTQKEWEKAAREITGWDYPWGDNINGSRANYWNSGDPWEHGTTPVGFYNGQSYQGFQTLNSASLYGVYDMAGNVWEWTRSWSSSSSFPYVRGGGWESPYYQLRSCERYYNNPTYSTYSYGFRCVIP